jgi:potassium channel subfamily K, other eukaryote
MSLFTIAYCDYYPQSSSRKSFFVFWSLLAIPSLTILISNMGDTVAKEISDMTLLLGDFTILPGEGGLKTNLKRAISKFTKGKLIGKRTGETRSTVLGQKNYSAHTSQNPDLGSASGAAGGLGSQAEKAG